MSHATRKQRKGDPGCIGKLGYPTRAEAETVRANLRQRRGDTGVQQLHAYHCPRCGRFHLGRNVKAGRPERVGSKHDHLAKLNRWRALTGEQK